MRKIIVALLLIAAGSAAYCSPGIVFDRLNNDMTGNNLPTLTGIATSGTTAITTVECRVNRGEWLPAQPVDGSFDSATERFSFKVPSPLARGTTAHLIEARSATLTGSYSFYVVGDRPEISLSVHGRDIIGGDPIEKEPAFTVTVLSDKGLTLNPLRGRVDKGAFTGITKTFDPGNPGIIRSTYSPVMADGVRSILIQMTDDLGNTGTREVAGLVVQADAGVSIQGIPLCHPNPYGGSGDIAISYILSKSSNTSVSVHDLMGRERFRESFSSGQPGGTAGYNEITWSGGGSLGNGIYIILITADGRLVGRGKLTAAK